MSWHRPRNSKTRTSPAAPPHRTVSHLDPSRPGSWYRPTPGTTAGLVHPRTGACPSSTQPAYQSLWIAPEPVPSNRDGDLPPGTSFPPHWNGVRSGEPPPVGEPRNQRGPWTWGSKKRTKQSEPKTMIGKQCSHRRTNPREQARLTNSRDLSWDSPTG